MDVRFHQTEEIVHMAKKLMSHRNYIGAAVGFLLAGPGSEFPFNTVLGKELQK